MRMFGFMILTCICAVSLCPVAVHGGFSNMLQFLTTGANIHSALKTLKDVSGMYKTAMKFPLLKEIINEVGNKNIQVKLILDFMNGHIPSIQDIFDLRGRQNHVYEDISSVLDTNQDLQQLLALFNKSDFASSKSDIEKSINIFFGHHLDLQSAMTLNPSTGTYQLTSVLSNKYRNLIEVVLLLRDNVPRLVNAMHQSGADMNVYLKTPMDLTHLAQVTERTFDGAKYGVSRVDADASEVIQLIKAERFRKPNISFEQGVDLTEQIYSKLISIFNKTLQQALATNTDVVG